VFFGQLVSVLNISVFNGQRSHVWGFESSVGLRYYSESLDSITTGGLTVDWEWLAWVSLVGACGSGSSDMASRIGFFMRLHPSMVDLLALEALDVSLAVFFGVGVSPA
jgi:hypothetical protein